MSAVKNFSNAASTFNGWLNAVDQKKYVIKTVLTLMKLSTFFCDLFKLN